MGTVKTYNLCQNQETDMKSCFSICFHISLTTFPLCFQCYARPASPTLALKHSWMRISLHRYPCICIFWYTNWQSECCQMWCIHISVPLNVRWLVRKQSSKKTRYHQFLQSWRVHTFHVLNVNEVSSCWMIWEGSDCLITKQ